jgi:hypothetical protein
MIRGLLGRFRNWWFPEPFTRADWRRLSWLICKGEMAVRALERGDVEGATAALRMEDNWKE